jgi:histidine ammonia-lyase
MSFKLGDDRLSCDILVQQAQSAQSVDLEVSEQAWSRLESYRQLIDRTLASGDVHYGINTGFGFLADVRIEEDKLDQLQVNLLRSHACGVGPELPACDVRALLILRAHTFFLGHTGISRPCVEQLLQFLKHDILPIIPSQGSVGASGDLAPLAHLALPLIGEGWVRFQGERMPAGEALQKAGLEPHRLLPKEGLSLINGTHVMTVLAARATVEARRLLEASDVMAALSLDAVKGSLKAFDERIHQVRQQPGQRLVAANIRRLFAGTDAIMKSHENCSKVQDPYSFRCIPQVHGACRDVLEHVVNVVEGELNSVTDNPLCFDDGFIVSGGNFHGEPIAMAADYLTVAMAEVGSISERRIEKLTDPSMSGLPAFVSHQSGLGSGFMIPHVVAAALVSENKTKSFPASVDSIPTSADKEDHVSMGPIAARKCLDVIHNTCRIIAIEGLTGCQGLDFLKPLQPAPALLAVYRKIRDMSPELKEDRSLHQDIETVADWILVGGVNAVVPTFNGST